MQETRNSSKFTGICGRGRGSHRRCFIKKDVFKNFSKFRGKTLRQNLVFDEVVGLRPVTLLKKRLWHKCFPVNFAKFLRTPFLQDTFGRLLLDVSCDYCLIHNMTFSYQEMSDKKDLKFSYKLY